MFEEMEPGAGGRARRRPGWSSRGDDRARITPMYKRLPRGPHDLDPGEVALNQRARIHGAMIEAVASEGYAHTTVRQVIGLAGVSRRAFYELFPNRQDCFLATFDLLARRELHERATGVSSAPGGLAPGLAAAFASCTRTAREEPKAATLMLLEAPTAGTPGVLRLDARAAATWERLLAPGLAGPRTAYAGARPGSCGRDRRRAPRRAGRHVAGRAAPVADGPRDGELRWWALRRQAAHRGCSRAARPLAACATTRAGRRSRRALLAPARRRTDVRERLLAAALRLAARARAAVLARPGSPTSRRSRRRVLRSSSRATTRACDGARGGRGIGCWRSRRPRPPAADCRGGAAHVARMLGHLAGAPVGAGRRWWRCSPRGPAGASSSLRYGASLGQAAHPRLPSRRRRARAGGASSEPCGMRSAVRSPAGARSCCRRCVTI